MTHIGECLGLVAPYYNLVLVVIVIILFIYLFKQNKKIYLAPWKLIFITIMIYVVEEILTILHLSEVINLSPLVAPILEMAMLAIVIYALLLQWTDIKKNAKK